VDFEQHLRRLFVYDEWANREFVQALAALQSPLERSHKLLAHIIAAEWVWLDRLEGRPQSMPVWPDLTIEECRRQTDELPLLWRRYFASLPSEQLSS